MSDMNVIDDVIKRLSENELSFTEVTLRKIDTNKVVELMEVLKYNNILKGLYLEYSELGTDGLEAVARMLECNCTIETLSLMFDGIDENGATLLARVLEQNNTLKELCMIFNCVGDVGAKAFAKMLCVNNTLTELYLVGNGITSEGIMHLKHAVENNKSIQYMSPHPDEIMECLLRNRNI